MGDRRSPTSARGEGAVGERESSTCLVWGNQAWVEDWEEEARKKNDCVTEAQLLAKYKGPVFRDPNTGKSFLIWEQNMEFRRGRGNGWFLVGGCADDEDDNEAFTLEIACELIGETPQRDGVQMIHWNEEE